MNHESFFQHKRITMLGLGLLGRGVGDAKFLAQCGAQVLVTDKKTKDELTSSVQQLEEFSNITFHLGEHRIEDFTNCDLVVKAAGVPLDSPYVAAARAAGIPVYMTTALFAKFAMESGVTVVGVTGTRGKSTTTQLIHHVLTTAQLSRNVVLGGNVRGISTLAMLPDVQTGDIAVLELDSWQLQGFGDLGISPNVAVFTNLMPDHQNYYASMDAYFLDKAHIFMHQKAGDTFVCGASMRDQVLALNPPVVPLFPEPLSEIVPLSIPGMHNRENAALAQVALEALGISHEHIGTGLASFPGVEGRLEFLKEVQGVKIYNDNNATTPDATIAGLRALSHGAKNIVLIMGGSDKGLEMGNLLYEIAGACKRVILLNGSGTSRVAPLMQDYSIYDSLHAAVEEALRSALPGDTILFSPAFASFGMFKNEYERNDQFVSLINSL